MKYILYVLVAFVPPAMPGRATGQPSAVDKNLVNKAATIGCASQGVTSTSGDANIGRFS